MFNVSLDPFERTKVSKITLVQDDDNFEPVAQIKIVGIGGGGCNAVDNMIKRGLTGVEFIAINTDLQSLKACSATTKVQIGKSLTKGLGAGSNVNVGKKAVEEDKDKIASLLANTELVFITTGLGGGTGTGGAPVVASIAKQMGALVVAVVTKPFAVEGTQRALIAERGLEKLREQVDSIIVIKNEILRSLMDEKCSVFEMFDKPNEVLYNATMGITQIIQLGGRLNCDFADVKKTMLNGGDTLIGFGSAKGTNRAKEAATKSVSSPLLEGIDIRGSRLVLANINASSSFTHNEFFEATQVIREAVGQDAFIKFGLTKNEALGEEVHITVIATGFNKTKYLNNPFEDEGFEDEITPKPVEPEDGPRLVQLQNQPKPEQPKLKIIPDINKVNPYTPETDKEYELPPLSRLGTSIEDLTKKDDDESFKKHFFDATKKESNTSENSSLLRKLMS